MSKHHSPHDAKRKRSQHQQHRQRLDKLQQEEITYAQNITVGMQSHLSPPEPPPQPSPAVACDPSTPLNVLWEFAREYPNLRYWIVANPTATPEILEFIAQQGGPGVAYGLGILLESLEFDRSKQTSTTTLLGHPA